MKGMDTQKIAEKYGVSQSTVDDILAGLRRTHGKQVQFSSEELGGMGQWSNGMTQIGRMGDADLKAKVNALCAELAEQAIGEPDSKTPDTATPHKSETAKREPHGVSSAGSQNGVRYAYYADKHRLEIERDGATKTYDTAGQDITGVAQSQGTGEPQTLRFSTTDGKTVSVDDLKPVDA